MWSLAVAFHASNLPCTQTRGVKKRNKKVEENNGGVETDEQQENMG
jgi:hypothetical protein